jgi:hypothetical protein
MTLKAATQLQPGDKVKVKKTREIHEVIEIEITPAVHTTNNMACVDIRLANGEWYGYKELSLTTGGVISCQKKDT